MHSGSSPCSLGVLHHIQKHLLASPVSSSSNFIKRWWWTLWQVLADPVNEELFGRLSSPAAGGVVKVTDVLWFVLLYNCAVREHRFIYIYIM